MNSSLRHRRRAERFAQLLDEADGGRRQHLRTSHDDELAALVALRHRLATTAAGPEADPEFRTGLRAMLLATAEREGIGRTAQPTTAPPALRRGGFLPASHPARRTHTIRPARGPRARTAVVAGVAVGAVAFTGMSTASENAVPGDPLYGVKRSTERAQLALASSEVGRGQLYLGFARTRLAEARTLASDLEQVLADMDRDTSLGVRLLTAAATNRQDPAALAAVDEFATGQREALEDLSGEVTGADLTRLAGSLALLDAIEQRTAELRQSLQDCGGPSATSIDSLGPVPGTCVALPAPSTLDLRPAPAAPPGAQSGTGDRTQPSGVAATQPADQPGDPATATDPAETGASAPAEEPGAGEGSTGEDGGLLSGLNRLLGNLLGG